jgi:hypothetical protein
MGAPGTAGGSIETRLDEVAHGVFATTYVIRDRYGNWRGDYASLGAARGRHGSLPVLRAGRQEGDPEGDPADAFRERDIDAALETAAECRRDASVYRQLGFRELSRWLLENARAAERWAAGLVGTAGR